tara:strand:- start:1661 stop:2959 length:1299 start_codon:yes stop_codon:yes gene_type:complete
MNSKNTAGLLKRDLSLDKVFENVADLLLADVAIKIQLPDSKYNLAIQRYETMSDWIDRKGSPLEGLVSLVYPQGSMSIGATVAAKGGTEEYDVDAVAQISFSKNLSPKVKLDLLFMAIKGEAGSRYYEMTERQSRCVTVSYEDDMHIDFVPALRAEGTDERISILAHHRPEEPEFTGYDFMGNPFGFAEWFKEQMISEGTFSEAYASRTQEYLNAQLITCASETEDIPEPEPVERKAMTVVALQLMKRFRDRRYKNRKDKKPPSVILAKLFADHANRSSKLSEELCFQATAIRQEFLKWHSCGQLIEINNPRCNEDCLTDRWPADLKDQQLFIHDLEYLLNQLNQIIGETDLEEKQTILTDLFGEKAAQYAINEYHEGLGRSIKENDVLHIEKGRIGIVASGLLGLSSSAKANGESAPSKSFYGSPNSVKRP